MAVTTTEAFFDSLQFKYEWRPYQKRVLDAIQHHLSDQKLHIVAAPGAGKTSLGLDVFRRLRQPALVLAPTRIIRDQWLLRLNDFLPAHSTAPAQSISRALNKPALLTAVTYQALHASTELSDEADDIEDSEEATAIATIDVDALVLTLQQHGIRVLILDEAHHLRAQWWRALEQLTAAIEGLTIVSLTATPPYDAPEHEWKKYEALCGPIDEEISVPELVKAGTLCAHQDFVWLCNATSTEKEKIAEHDAAVFSLLNELCNDTDFDALIQQHPYLQPGCAEETIMADPEVVLALLVYCHFKIWTLPGNLLQKIDYTISDIPPLSRHWWQVLIQALLSGPHLQQDEYIKTLRKRLQQHNLLYKKELCIEASRRLLTALSTSPTKLQACLEIHLMECEVRQSSLRQVILTDFIRDDQIDGLHISATSQLGAWPVFQLLSQHSPLPTELALLTGRLSILHRDQRSALSAVIDISDVEIRPLSFAPAFCQIVGPISTINAAFTALLQHGHIKTLIGTRALLGEGWDAPVVNSLVLASNVAAFMLTNQMRGRAIRIHPQQPDKASSIWHLVAIDGNEHFGLSDLRDLQRRFETFVGLSEYRDVIESGFERLSKSAIRSDTIAWHNATMKQRLHNVSALPARWQHAIEGSRASRVLPSTFTNAATPVRHLYLRDTLRFLLLYLATSVGSVLCYTFIAISKRPSLALSALLTVSVLLLLWHLPQLITAIKICWRHLPIDQSFKQLANALAVSLCEAGYIKTPPQRLMIHCESGFDGSWHIALSGGTFYESSLFADSFNELLSPIENQRYLLVRKGKFLAVNREDYHAIPLRLANNKTNAELFLAAWRRHVGPSDLIYTRTDEGRRLLLKAKMLAYSSVFARKVKRSDRWR